MGRPRKPDDQKKVRVSFYLSPEAARALREKGIEVHEAAGASGVPTLPGFCAALLEQAAGAIRARKKASPTLRSIDETAGIERGPDGLPSRLHL